MIPEQERHKLNAGQKSVSVYHTFYLTSYLQNVNETDCEIVYTRKHKAKTVTVCLKLKWTFVKFLNQQFFTQEYLWYIKYRYMR